MKIYQIGVPSDRISTALMLWDAHEMPCAMTLIKAKTPDMAVIEVTHELLAADILKTLPDAKLNIKTK